uniref:Undecaprenyl-diphosphatase n=1 Tax=Candidatus Kentrum sp. FM TaxID=2126340 RepID=A0A450T7Z6_9GAMM|nr:MAG: undecaprenyl-diphosphatase [Candidatus Kentron sp. FM]VFJ62756.1 MAG: undecaprenyl-diphosphatase [Candidatus Kentron sp. FM]VFK09307.1 MAG: undecaprenyl-diphosphatase [Candidatus Kentron sp. FM]
MDSQQAIILSLLQGLTEFLPISSSAHLILLPYFLDWPDQGLAFDVAVHVGTLCAVVGYFRREIAGMGRDWYRSIAERRRVGTSPLAWGVMFGTIPVVLAGGLLSLFDTAFLRTPEVIAGSTVFFALVLWWADKKGARARDEHTLGRTDILIIGLAQTLALIPGTSRAGITLTAGLALGLTRAGAARFSFLLAIPTIACAGTLTFFQVLDGTATVAWTPLVLGTVLSAVSAYLCIHWFLRLLERVGLVPFILYRLLLGGVLFLLLL